MSIDDPLLRVEILLNAVTGQEKEHWFTLLRRVSVLLIRSVASAPSYVYWFCSLIFSKFVVDHLLHSRISKCYVHF